MNERHRFFVVCAECRSDAGMVISVLENAGCEVECTYRATKYRRKFDPTKHRALVLLGNDEGDADDCGEFAPEMEWVTAAKENRRAVLGICHGAQLLAHVFGAKLSKWTSFTDRGLTHLSLTTAGVGDPVLRHVQHVKVPQWHYHSFAAPEGTIELARSTREDRPHCEAFRVDDNIYGLQFHPEPTAKQLSGEWKSGEHGETLAGAERAGRAVLEAWVEIAMRG